MGDGDEAPVVERRAVVEGDAEMKQDAEVRERHRDERALTWRDVEGVVGRIGIGQEFTAGRRGGQYG